MLQKFCLMASYGYPSELGFQQEFVMKGCQQFVPYHVAKPEIVRYQCPNLRLSSFEESRMTSKEWFGSNQFVNLELSALKPMVVDVKATCPSTVLFSFGAVDRCTEHDKTLYIFFRDADILKSVPRVKQLRDLRQLLDAEKSPLVVAVSGRVVSKSPIVCQMSRLSSVIVEERVEELNLHKKVATEQEMKSNDDDDSWTLHSKMISSIPKEVPWFLDDGTDRVHVVGARGATGFELPAENTTFETLGNRMREKTIGFKRIERVLPVGTSLNVVGEASKDDAGTVWIQRPPKGPFYVTCKTIDEHATDLVKSSSWRMATSVCMTGFGVWCFFSII